MFQKTDQLTKLSRDMTTSEFQIKINCWDEELTDYIKAEEKKFHKFKQTHIDWSPDVGVWIRRLWLLERIGKWLDGRVPDPHNLIRAFLKRNISDPREMTRNALQTELFIFHKKA